MPNSTLENEFTTFIQKQLIQSCDQMYELAKENCKGSYLDNNSCEWYHSAWQYLRVLDKVSSPTWHFDFYYEEFNRLVTNDTNILVSGTADYSILALIYFVASKKNVSPKIWVCDICNTPLSICQSFAEETIFQFQFYKATLRQLKSLNDLTSLQLMRSLQDFPLKKKH